MEIRTLIDQLRRPRAFPRTPREVEVHQTHISVVFLAGDLAYKVKKPLDLGFLDFTTLERRRHFCLEEVRLNRRLAPNVYLGVVPVTRESDGLRFEGEGKVVDWAVKMVRLPPEATLRERLLRDALSSDTLVALAARLAEFHREAASGPGVSRHGRFEVVARNARENLGEAGSRVGAVLSEAVHQRLSLALEERLAELRSLIQSRADEDVPRDTHGDLHLDHVYLFPERDPPDDLVIIDCIEFGDRFRCSDPVADMAFLAMDLIHHGRRDLEEDFSEAYFQAAGDREGRSLLPFYRSYRAAVRGKVDGMLTGPGVSPEEEAVAARSARGHWLLALSELEPPSRRPGLVLVGGLPGTGKSTLAGGLAREGDFRLISSDRVRKGLAGEDSQPPTEGFEKGLYTPEWTYRTYRACLDEARQGLFQGERILIDASFRDEEHRAWFLEAAREHGVRVLFLRCEARPDTVRDRLAGRRGGPSDADWSIYVQAKERWESPSPRTLRHEAHLSTEGVPEAVLARAMERLSGAGLAEWSR